MLKTLRIDSNFYRLKNLFQVLSLCLALLIFHPVAMAEGSGHTEIVSGHSLVLLYADIENSLGQNFQDFDDGQSETDSGVAAKLRTEIQSHMAANPDIVVRLMVDQASGSKIYTLKPDTEMEVEEWVESGSAYENFTAFLTQSINKFSDNNATFFSPVNYDNGWIQSVRPVVDPLNNPCIANPARWRDHGRPDTPNDGGRPLPGGGSAGIGHTDLERTFCDVYEATNHKIGLLRLETVLDFLSNRSNIGECSSLGSLLPHITIKPQYINVSSTSGGTVAGIPFQNRDILRYDMTNNLWSMLFDASDAGINKGNLVGFHTMDDGSILFSMSRPLSIPGLGRVDDSDIVRFFPTQLGFETTGYFERYFDGSDVKLTRGSEDIDAISILADGRLLISTVGNVSVTGVHKGRDEDVLLFEPTRLGKVTKGKWSLYLDGSKVGLKTKNENIVGIDFDPSLPAREALHLATRGNFVVPMLRGANPDILSYAPDEANQCTFEMSQRWDNFQEFFAGEKLDGISYQIDQGGGLVTASSTVQMALGNTEQLISSTESGGYQLYLPIVSQK